jgi:hypothetical protein
MRIQLNECKRDSDSGTPFHLQLASKLMMGVQCGSWQCDNSIAEFC